MEEFASSRHTSNEAVLQRRAHGMTIKAQLVLLLALVLFLLFAVFLGVYARMAGIIMEKNERHVRELFAIATQNITREYDTICAMIYSCGNDPDVLEFMGCEDPVRSYELNRILTNRFSQTQIDNPGVFDIVLLGEYQNFSLKGRVTYVQQAAQQMERTTDVQNIGVIIERISYFDEMPPGTVFSAYLYDFSDSSGRLQPKGVVGIVYKAQNLLFQYYLGEARHTQLFLVDRDGIICAQNSEYSATAVGDSIDFYYGGNYIVNEMELPSMTFRVVGATDRSLLFSELNSVRNTLLAIFTAALAVLLLLFSLSIHRIVAPINKITAFIGTIRDGSIQALKQRMDPGGGREMALLSSEFNSMLEEINDLTHRLFETNTRMYEAELEKNKAEISMLRSQINPHFLYNTLECIKGMAYEQDALQIVEMTNSLSKIFRYSIKGPDIVPLRQELGVCKAFIFIQAMRFDDKFDVQYDISEEALSTPVLKMLLQPLIENAFVHGIEPMERCGKLLIRGYVENGRLILSVGDNGRGMDAARLEQLQDSTRKVTPTGSHSDSIGILNISNRIKQIYGASYGIEVESKPDHGTTVTVIVPERIELPSGGEDVVPNHPG